MRKPVHRDGGDRKGKIVGGLKSEPVAAESVLPHKKPPAPSAKHRLKRGRKAKLMK
jgi:hypothetical protein